MFYFFFNLAWSIYLGEWVSTNPNTIETLVRSFVPASFTYIGTLFSDNGATFPASINIDDCLAVTICMVVSIICCIAFFFLIVKAVKKLFNVFLGE